MAVLHTAGVRKRPRSEGGSSHPLRPRTSCGANGLGLSNRNRAARASFPVQVRWLSSWPGGLAEMALLVNKNELLASIVESVGEATLRPRGACLRDMIVTYSGWNSFVFVIGVFGVGVLDGV